MSKSKRSSCVFRFRRAQLYEKVTFSLHRLDDDGDDGDELMTDDRVIR